MIASDVRILQSGLTGKTGCGFLLLASSALVWDWLSAGAKPLPGIYGRGLFFWL